MFGGREEAGEGEASRRTGKLPERRISDLEGAIATVGAELLDRIQQPVIVITGARSIIFSNSIAKSVIAKGDLVRDKAGLLECHDVASDLVLARALGSLGMIKVTRRSSAPPQERSTLRFRSRGGRTVAATLVAIRTRKDLALLSLFDPGAVARGEPRALQVTYGLTPAETRLAARISNGRSTDQCASDLGVKVSTVRAQLHSIYVKTGARNQADLVRLAMSAAVI